MKTTVFYEVVHASERDLIVAVSFIAIGVQCRTMFIEYQITFQHSPYLITF